MFLFLQCWLLQNKTHWGRAIIAVHTNLCSDEIPLSQTAKKKDEILGCRCPQILVELVYFTFQRPVTQL